MKIDPKRLRLYAVTDRAWTHDAEGLLRQVAAAVDGGECRIHSKDTGNYKTCRRT